MPSPDAALIEAIPAVRAAFLGWCGPLVGGRAFWAQTPAPGIARPLIVIQSQDGGGAAVPYVGSMGWGGEVVVRAIATASAGGLASAETIIRSVAASVPPGATLSVGAATFAATIQLVGPVVIPPAADAWTSALRYRVELHPS